MNIKLSCQCGEVTGLAKDITHKNSNHIICYCDDCQAYAYYLGNESHLLDINGGLEILQMDAKRIQIEKGLDKVKSVCFSSKLIRWHTACCKTPIAVTLTKPTPSFAGVVVSFVSNKNDLGPINAKVFACYARGVPPTDSSHKLSIKFMLYFLRMIGLSVFNYKWKMSPFFPKNGQPITKPIKISTEMRKELLKKVTTSFSN